MELEYSYRLAELRRKAGKTQREVVEEIGGTPAALSAYEKGTKMPSMDVAIKLADYYKVSLDYIFRALEAEYDTPSTYADVLRCLFKISKAELSMSVSAIETMEDDIARLELYDDYLVSIFNTWRGLLESNRSGQVDDEVLELWEKKKMEQAAEKRTPNAQEAIDAFVTTHTPVTEEDLPF